MGASKRGPHRAPRRRASAPAGARPGGRSRPRPPAPACPPSPAPRARRRAPPRRAPSPGPPPARARTGARTLFKRRPLRLQRHVLDVAPLPGARLLHGRLPRARARQNRPLYYFFVNLVIHRPHAGAPPNNDNMSGMRLEALRQWHVADHAEDGSAPHSFGLKTPCGVRQHSLSWQGLQQREGFSAWEGS